MTQDANTNVISIPTLVLSSFIDFVKKELPDINYVYDDMLEYSSSVRNFLSIHNKNKTKLPSPEFILPLFSFKRTPIIWSKAGLGRRSSSLLYTFPKDSTSSVDVYKSVHGEFEIDFSYFTTSVEDLERFEISFLANENLTGEGSLIVSLADIDIPYSLYFNNFDEMTFSKGDDTGLFFKGIKGKIRVIGSFPVFKEGAAPIILEIRERIYNFYNVMLAEQFIYPK